MTFVLYLISFMIFYLIADSIQLRTSSVNATLGETFTFIIDEVVNKEFIYIAIQYSAHNCRMRLNYKNSNRCMVAGCPFITGHEIECTYAIHTITITIPGEHMLEHFHKTQWIISNRRTRRLAMKILYINGM